MEGFWNEKRIRKQDIEQLKKSAINMACEAIQVAAMAEKALRIETEDI